MWGSLEWTISMTGKYQCLLGNVQSGGIQLWYSSTEEDNDAKVRQRYLGVIRITRNLIYIYIYLNPEILTADEKHEKINLVPCPLLPYGLTF